jgi:hypothetical protein
LPQVPLSRIGDCETDIGEGVAMLCSPMAVFLTGATIPPGWRIGEFGLSRRAGRRASLPRGGYMPPSIFSTATVEILHP